MGEITIVMTTYFPPGAEKQRLSACLRTIESWAAYLTYSGPLVLYIADDGSDPNYPTKVFEKWHKLTGKDAIFSQRKRRGVGASLNRGMARGFETSPLVLYAVDDWSLTGPMDLNPWAEMLMEREDIGMVRLGPPHPNIRGQVEHLGTRGWWLRLDQSVDTYTFAHRPALYHKRLISHYGWFDEDVTALQCEQLYGERVRRDLTGPGVALALLDPWEHIYSIELADIDPHAS